ncbi:hypothetical protein BU25DRAFT_417800 [Macroventuria anomochaeta]|uniref:Uncharacterized protein n=1 Tax=Macroventuria anomochaeta TaxID=301207 RepID=A0ACB6SDJ3_9PLEO|nr:uncharacterized protein BU25DRAFT_417800 [Macroventuria anomochaeta]KAF2632038.1 hypothetical protein BU25DRAFT_417800 [Macroventuria anomochaeta]
MAQSPQGGQDEHGSAIDEGRVMETFDPQEEDSTPDPSILAKTDLRQLDVATALGRAQALVYKYMSQQLEDEQTNGTQEAAKEEYDQDQENSKSSCKDLKKISEDRCKTVGCVYNEVQENDSQHQKYIADLQSQLLQLTEQIKDRGHHVQPRQDKFL